jgi:hypothetical protein
MKPSEEDTRSIRPANYQNSVRIVSEQGQHRVRIVSAIVRIVSE